MSRPPLGRRARLVAVVGFVAVLALVVMAVATAMSHDDGPVARPFAADLAGNGVLAVISMGPGSVGENEVHIFLTPPGGSIVPIADATVQVTLGDQVIEAALVRESANHYSGTIDFPSAGDWDLDLHVQIDAADVDGAASTADMRTVVPISAG